MWVTISLGMLLGLIAAVMTRFSIKWSGLFLIGLTVLVCSLAVANAKTYWLAIFALLLPLEVKKMLVDSSFIVDFIRQYGFPTGELPGPVVYISDLPLLVLLLLWLYEAVVHGKRIRFPRAHWLAVALLGWSALSMLNARDLASAFFDLCRGVKLYVLYILAYNTFAERKPLRVLLIALLAGVVLQGVICLAQFASPKVASVFTSALGKKDLQSSELKSATEGFMRITEGGGIAARRAGGTVGPINAEAYYFEQLLPMAFLAWLAVRRWPERHLGLLATALGTMGLLVTFSRGGLLGLCAAATTVLVLAWLRNAVSRQRIVLLVLAGLILMVSASPLVARYFGSRPEGASARLYLMKVGLQMVADHPVLGVGLNNHLQAKTDYDIRTYAVQMPTHNHFIMLASQIGIPGLLLFLGFLASVWFSALKASRSQEAMTVCVAIGTAAALVAIVVHSQFDYIGTQANLSLLWLFAGIVAALANQQVRHETQLRPEVIETRGTGNG